jgi:hypothetical protein
MLAIWLVPLLANLHGLLARAIGAAISSPWATGPDLPGTTVWHPLTAILVLSVLGAYHGRLLAAEGAWREEGGPLATARRVFLLFFTAMGTLLTAAAALQLLVMTLNGAVTPAALDVGLRPALPGVVARLAVGLLAWLTAGWALQRQYRRGWIGERQSALRPLYLHGFAVISMLATLGTAGILLAGALQRIMGLPVMGTGIQQIAVLVVGACGWLYHTQVLSEDAAAEALGARQRGLARLRRYVVAGVALSAALVAVAALIQVVIRAGMHAGAAEALRSQLAFGVAFLAVALPPWAVTWSQAQRAAALEGDQGAVERQSASRKLYLYFFLLMATVVVLSGAVYVVYRALAGVMAIAAGPDVPSQLAEAVAYALLGAALWAFHARIIRDDERQAQAERRARAATFQAVVLDPGGWPPGAAIARSLSEELIGSSVAHLDLHAGQGPGAPPPRDLAAAADLVIAPWPAPEAESALRDLLEAAGGRRLLVAREVPGWSWLGTVRRTATRPSARPSTPPARSWTASRSRRRASGRRFT